MKIFFGIATPSPHPKELFEITLSNESKLALTNLSYLKVPKTNLKPNLTINIDMTHQHRH